MNPSRNSTAFEFCPGLCVFIKDNHGQLVFRAAEELHKRVCFCFPFRLLQDLDPCLVRYEELEFKELPVKVIIRGLSS